MDKEKKDYLIVVDMQNDFVTGALGTPEAQAIVPKVVEKIKNWDGPILYTQDTHFTNYLETEEGKHLPVEHCIRKRNGWEIVDEVYKAIPWRMSMGYEKHGFGSRDMMEDFYDAVYDTNDEFHYDYEPKSITLIGLCTDICVISNAIMLKSAIHEVPIIVDASCCAGVTPESHKNALAAMKMCQIEIINE